MAESDRTQFEGLTFKVASSAETLRALELRDQIYARELGHVPQDGLDEVADHLVAIERGGDVVAAFRIVGPQYRPFEFERVIALKGIICADSVPAMIGRLWVRKDYRRISRSSVVHLGLLRLAYGFALARSITDFFLFTFDHLVPFYRRAHFHHLPVPYVHPHWGAMQVMHLDLRSHKSRSPQAIPFNGRRG